MYYLVRPTPVKDLKPDDLFRDGGQNFRIAGLECDDHVALSDYNDDAICVYTLEGPMWFDEGDYVIKGVYGEFYPCQKVIFEETYEKVN